VDEGSELRLGGKLLERTAKTERLERESEIHAEHRAASGSVAATEETRKRQIGRRTAHTKFEVGTEINKPVTLARENRCQHKLLTRTKPAAAKSKNREQKEP
jgi:hypothetical protein